MINDGMRHLMGKDSDGEGLHLQVDGICLLPVEGYGGLAGGLGPRG